MKLVDLTLRAKSSSSNANHKKKDGGSNVTLHKVMENFQTQFQLARMRREEVVKIKDIKSLAFGKYSIQVPSFNLGEFGDCFESVRAQG